MSDLEFSDVNGGDGLGPVVKDGGDKSSPVAAAAAPASGTFAAKYFSWATLENAKLATLAFFNLLTALAILAFIATGMYASVLAIPVISAGMLAAFGLALPQGLITFIAILPVIATAAVFLRFLQIHWEIRRDLEKDVNGKKFRNLNMREALILTLFKALPGYLVTLFEHAFMLDVVAPAILADPKANVDARAKAKASQENWAKFNRFAGVVALAFGGYLAYYIAPFVMTAVMSLGMPFPVAVLFGALAAATVIAITYQLLASLVTLRNLALSWNWLKIANEPKFYDPYKLFYVSGAAIVVVVSVGAAYLFFPLLVNALTPVLTQGLATFTAIAVSVSLTLLMMRFVPQVVAGTLLFISKIPGEVKSWVESYKQFKTDRALRDKLKASPAAAADVAKDKAATEPLLGSGSGSGSALSAAQLSATVADKEKAGEAVKKDESKAEPKAAPQTSSFWNCGNRTAEDAKGKKKTAADDAGKDKKQTATEEEAAEAAKSGSNGGPLSSSHGVDRGRSRGGKPGASSHGAVAGAGGKSGVSLAKSS